MTDSHSPADPMPIGATLRADGTTRFRVWAPKHTTVDVVIGDDSSAQRTAPLEPEGNGYFSADLPDAPAGSLYRFRLGGANAFPDPASRFQPDGPQGPSMVIDPHSFAWTDDKWHGPSAPAPVFYELHVGTFTEAGTWAAATKELPSLAELGITAIELMPVAEFAGQFGWGYDGVNLFAPSHLYGTPDDFRAFVNRAHELGLAVVLDVVYNHFGPDGNYIGEYSGDYLTSKHKTEWGDPINFDGENCAPVREFFLANASYWIREFHLDGLRIDATQNIYDDSSPHILTEITQRVRAAAGRRSSFVVAENESQDVRMLRPASEGGFAMDAAWNDDWHHSAIVALTGRDEAYYMDYRGRASEFVAAAKFGFLYQGQWYAWRDGARGTPSLDVAPCCYIHFLQNHDQVANSFRGDRLHRVASPRKIRAMTALLLLGPQTPLIFQGQEFGASTPFQYFADHDAALTKLILEGRTQFLSRFSSIAEDVKTHALPDPRDPATFEQSKLLRSEREAHGEVYQLHADLLELRRHDAVFGHPRHRGVDGATLRDDAFVLRFTVDGNDRLLIVNLGGPLHLHILPEPLLAPPAAGPWTVLWHSEEPRYGGLGIPALDPGMKGWIIPGECAVAFAPRGK